MNLARRSITSASWTTVTSLTTVVVLAVRSIILARLLPVEVFGIYGLATSIMGLSVVVIRFGMGGAFLHRSPETEDEQEAAAVLFTLKCIFTVIGGALLAASAFVIFDRDARTALLLLVATRSGVELAQIPQLILARRVVYRRLALLRLSDVLLSSLLALTLAWQGVTLWALLATDIVTLVVVVVGLYVWRPVWRPRLGWSRSIVRYYLTFGSQSFLAVLLLQALDRVDDLWTGFYLGDLAMGFYSKAYRFATYPRSILADPITGVAGGTYAELKHQRLRLSRAFFRTNAFLVRSGFLLAGLLVLVAPEFIRILLGVKWLPMLDAFRLMLIFTLFDPIKSTVASLFIAVGRPELVVRARLIQLLVMVAGLLLLSPTMGITGVALAVDAMLVVGIAILLRQARTYVDFSAKRLFAVPFLGLVTGLAFAHGAILLPGVAGSDWRTGLVKILVFSLVYGFVLGVLERQQLSEMLVYLASHVIKRDAKPSGASQQIGS